jgi:hypothetical protein
VIGKTAPWLISTVVLSAKVAIHLDSRNVPQTLWIGGYFTQNSGEVILIAAAVEHTLTGPGRHKIMRSDACRNDPRQFGPLSRPSFQPRVNCTKESRRLHGEFRN